MAASLGEGGNVNLNAAAGTKKVNIRELKDYYRAELFAFLDEYVGNKILVWDDELTGSIGMLVSTAELEAREVQKRMYSLSIKELPRDAENRHVIFLVRPRLDLMNDIVHLVTNEKSYNSVSRRDYHILFVPRESEACIRKLRYEGVFNDFATIESFRVNLLPLETDLLSMGYSDCIKECFLDADFSCMFDVASSVMTLQYLYGVIPNVYCKGECAKRVLNIMMRLRREQSNYEEQITPQIDNLILIDRTADLLTPFLTQLTYEGFIDELFEIKNNSVRIDADKLPSVDDKAPTPADGKKKVTLTSNDQLYSELRDKNFNAVGPMLSSKAKAVSAKYDERNQAKSIGELKEFVQKLPQMQAERQSVATHTAIAQMIKEHIASESFKDGLYCQQELRMGVDVDKSNSYIDDCISRADPLHKVLRLIAVQSYCNNGLKPQVLNFYKSAILQAYGYDAILLINNMEKAGFIKTQNQYSKTYSSLKKNLGLLVEDVNEQNPTDIAYVYSGYAPLSIRIIQNAIRPGWRSIQNSLQLLPGEIIEEVQQLPGGVRKRRTSITSSNSSMSNQLENRVTLVFFIGGVTYAEIAALRFLQQEEHPTDYIIATTHIINGDSLINSIKPSSVSINGKMG